MPGAETDLDLGAYEVRRVFYRSKDGTRVPMFLAAVGYWVVGFGGSILFGFGLGLGAVGIWMGLALGLAAVAGLLVMRFHWRDRFLAPAVVTP